MKGYKEKYKYRLKQNATVVLIISCIFAVISTVLLIIMLASTQQTIKNVNEAKYLYENGIEVDAHIKSYYISYYVDHNGFPFAGNFILKLEYIDENGLSYQEEYEDNVVCREDEEYEIREQYIKRIIEDDKTFKLLIADNGWCILAENKENLIGIPMVIVPILTIVISSIILGLCIFGIVRQSKKLIGYKKLFN